MADQLHRLIYCSRAFAETRDLHAHVEQILSVSRARNQADDVTGLLLLHEGWFLQALEGPKGAVARTYGRILCDRRHSHPLALAGGAAASRAFGEWSMSARPLAAADRRELSRRRLTFDPKRLDGEAALSLLLASAQEPELGALRLA